MGIASALGIDALYYIIAFGMLPIILFADYWFDNLIAITLLVLAGAVLNYLLFENSIRLINLNLLLAQTATSCTRLQNSFRQTF